MTQKQFNPHHTSPRRGGERTDVKEERKERAWRRGEGGAAGVGREREKGRERERDSERERERERKGGENLLLKRPQKLDQPK